LRLLRHPIPTLFPYTTLFRSVRAGRDHPRAHQVADREGPAGRVSHFRRFRTARTRRAEPTARRALRTAAATASPPTRTAAATARSEEHTSELQSRFDLVCRLL